MENKNYELVEVELDSIEPLEDTLAPCVGFFCKGCVNPARFCGLVCG